MLKIKKNLEIFKKNSNIRKIIYIFQKKEYRKNLVIAFFLTLIITLLSTFIIFLKDLPSPTKLSSYDIEQTSKIYDRNGTLLYEIYADKNRTLVKLDSLPKYLLDATIATEDKDFYKHGGINPIGGILRAVKETVSQQNLQGGSTITQQLVKNALLNPERTIQRKIKEIFLSFWVELLYNKNQILEMYLNHVPYGGTAWGIETAAQNYFGKSAKDLTLAESALLAGLPAAPTAYSPFGAKPELAQARQKHVLSRMLEDGLIDQKQMDEALMENLTFRPQNSNIKAPHFVMYVKEKLVEKYGLNEVEKGGLKITTTLDLDIQEKTEQHVASEVAKLKNYNVGNSAALVTRPPTGEIIAMVGSKNYFDTENGNYNVTTSLRQPGSAIKPINYAIGIETKKVTAASLFLDVPTCFSVAGQKNYCPVNYDGQYHGATQLRFALGNSFNIPAVKMMALNGVETMIASSSAMGISSFKDPSQYGLSLTLGGGEVTMLDMATAFGVFANNGIKKDLVYVLKVENAKGEILEEYQDNNIVADIKNPIGYPSTLLINGPKVLSSETSFLISHILLDNNARSQMFGSSSFLVVPDKSVSVKTGTTDDKRDNWTIGYTPNFLAVVWVGNNDNKPMNPFLTSGVTGAAPIWNKIMRDILANQPELFPKQPAGIIGAQICAISGKAPPNPDTKASDRGCQTRFEYFINGTVPKEPENLKRVVAIDKTNNKLAGENQTENVEQQEKSVLDDGFSIYCLDCNNEKSDPPKIIRL